MIPTVPTMFAGPWRGLLSRKRRTDHPSGYAHEARNVELFGDVIGLRGGTKRQTNGQFGVPGDRRITGMQQNKWRPGSGSDDILVAAGPALQQLGDPPSADLYDPARLPAGAPDRLTPRHSTIFTQLDNKTFICDGTNGINLKYTYRGGTARLERWGIDAPESAPTVTLQGGGPLTGRRTYRATAVNSVTQHESEPSDESVQAVFDAANGQAVIRAPLHADPQVDRIRLYATHTDGSGVWFFIGEVLPGETVLDNFVDFVLGIELEEFVNDPPPDRLRLAAPWPQASRVLAVADALPSLIYYSDLLLGQLKPEAFPPTNVIAINLDAGDEILALYPMWDSVIVVCRRSMWRLLGTPGADLQIEPIQFEPSRTAVGGFGQRAMAQIDDVLANPFLDGLYLIGRFAGDIKAGFTSSRLSRAIDEAWGAFNPAAIRNVHAVFHRQRRQLRVFLPQGLEWDAARVLVYQLDIAADQDLPAGWTEWYLQKNDGSPQHVSASLVIESAQGDRVLIGTADGYVLAMDESYFDDWAGSDPTSGSLYPMQWEDVPVALAPTVIPARLRYLELVARAGGATSLTVTPLVDFSTEAEPLTFALAAPTGFVLGTSILGVDVLGGDPVPALLRGTLLVRGTYHALRFDHPGGVALAVDRWTLRWQPQGVKSADIVTEQRQPEPFGFPGGEGGFA